jgi:hypothetical protein
MLNYNTLSTNYKNFVVGSMSITSLNYGVEETKIKNANSNFGA